jgi:hypothetical protein
MKRDRLGKGLGALIREYSPGDEPGTGEAGLKARTLAIADIAPNPFQPRREFSRRSWRT